MTVWFDTEKTTVHTKNSRNSTRNISDHYVIWLKNANSKTFKLGNKIAWGNLKTLLESMRKLKL